MTTRWQTGLSALTLALLAAAPAQALYKVVGPDGKVTYTDRSPQEGQRVAPSSSTSATAAPAVALPLELRQVASRYPVTLYVVPEACEPCDAGRQFLRQRGIPHVERQVVSNADAEALQSLTGGRDAPVLSIGSQVMRGFSGDMWAQYLDLAGYPKTSRLPANYRFQAATPLTERQTATAPAAPRQTPPAAAQDAAPAPAVTAPPPAPGSIRF